MLGITVVTGDQWRDEEVAHALRLLEIIGRTDIPVVPGAVFPLARTKDATAEWEKRYGKVPYQGAWGALRPTLFTAPGKFLPCRKAGRARKPASEDAAHFLVRMVRRYPHQVTIYAGGPLTDLALAQSIDPDFASLSQGTGCDGRQHPPANEGPRIPGRAASRIQFLDGSRGGAPRVARAVASGDGDHGRYFGEDAHDQSADRSRWRGQEDPQRDMRRSTRRKITSGTNWRPMAWLDPSIITRSTKLYMDVSVDHGTTYGDTLTWSGGPEASAASGRLWMCRKTSTPKSSTGNSSN